MKYYKRILIQAMTMTLVLLMPALAMAQPNPGCDPAIDPACVPIDGGLSLLIGAGIVYGIKRVRDKEK